VPRYFDMDNIEEKLRCYDFRFTQGVTTVEGEAENPVKMREYIASLQGEVANVVRIARTNAELLKTF